MEETLRETVKGIGDMKLRLCLNQMIKAFQRLEEAKNDCKVELSGAYAAYARKPNFGDDLIPEKILYKLAEAMTKDTLSAKGGEAAAFLDAIKKTTGQVLLPGVEEAA